MEEVDAILREKTKSIVEGSREEQNRNRRSLSKIA